VPKTWISVSAIVDGKRAGDRVVQGRKPFANRRKEMLTAKEVLHKTVDSWNASDEAGVLAMAAPGVELTAPAGLDYKGVEGFRQWYRLWAEACPDQIVRYHNLIGERDQVIGEGTFTGTHTGVLRLPSGDVPPTGKHVSADYVAVLRTSGGKITYMRHYFDVMDLMAQLGLVGAEAKV
jgi:predicted ester cyclase